ncbi:hypothetical protein TruAng_005396 [Truncatella angustata]|nr:hypothetical protein TruAng_005396 [Truncatella angustata]
MEQANIFVCGDDSFGPSVKSVDCRGGFDFTGRIRVKRNALYVCKLTTIGAYIGLQLALLVLSTQRVVRTQVSIASASLSLVSGLSLALLSHLEHAKTIRPSFLINFYLLTTVLFDATRVRTQWLAGQDSGAAGALSASLFMKCIMLALEAVEKRSLLLGLDRHFSRESTSGMISRSAFWWLNSLMFSGSKTVLSIDSLPAIHEKLNSEDLARDVQPVWDQCNQERKHALAFACTWALRWEVLMILIPKFAYVALSLSQTYLIQAAVRYVAEAGSDEWSSGYGLIAAFGLVYIGLAVMMGWSSHLTYRLMTMMRGQLTSLIYSKALMLPITGANESAAMTLMGADVQSIAASYHFLLLDLVPSVVQLAIAIYLLYTQLGAVCVAPVLVALISTGISTVLAGHVTSRQKHWYGAIQERINYTSEILGSMRNVKMLGLSQKMTENIQSMREDEMNISRRFRKVQSLNVSLANAPYIFNNFLVFAVYAIVAKLHGGDSFSVSQAVTALAAVTLLSTPLGRLLNAIPTGWASLGCFTRIQEFLLQEVQIEQRTIPASRPSRGSVGHTDDIELQYLGRISARSGLRIEKSSFGWSSSSNIVKDVSTDIGQDIHLTIVVGPVGCGKSTLLKGLLGETPRISGDVFVPSSKIAFCDQTPWIINGFIKDNVVAASELDEAWYHSVINACALEVDMRKMPDGDQTIVGSKGVKLSGGQKQRLSIARAVYARKSLAIFDDVLSGLDSVTEEIIFQRVFGPAGLLRKTGTQAVLATHSVKRLPKADLILALDTTGRIAEEGTFQELNKPGSYIHSLRVELAKEQVLDEQSGCQEQPIQATATGFTEAGDSMARKTGDWATYRYYTRALGHWPLSIFVALVILNECSNGMGTVWLKWWASGNESEIGQPLGYWLGIYALFNLLEGIGLCSAVAWLWIYIIPKSGNNLHRIMLDAATKAPLSFFAATETGVLVNRFSQDLRLADIALPGSIINVAFQIGSCLVIMAINVTAVQYFVAVLPPVCFVLYFIQRFYLKTSRQLRLLEIEANAPLFSHLIETQSGLATIRSFGWTRDYTLKNRLRLDESQKPYYLLLCIQRWLVLVLDLVVAGLTAVLVGMAVALRTKLDAGFLGLALVGMMNLSHSLTDLVQHYTMLETTLGAIARIKDFAENTPAERRPGEDDSPDVSWPSQGAIEFKNVFASYSVGASPVLKDVTFSIEGGEKLGIVGRTGSGKSSSTLAIMRMIDLVGGKIILDGIDLSTLTGAAVRERLNCLTQDPFLYPASIRANVDPLDTSSNEAIVAALNKVGLWSVLKKKTADEDGDVAAILDTPMDQDFLSHGQRQLFCLARALLKPGKVLVLDEPTSSVDTRTDAQMQEIIRSEFKSHTIIMIAHRLSSLMDFDKVAVLDGGRLIEFGKPADLVKDRSSAFTKLYQGSAVSH